MGSSLPSSPRQSSGLDLPVPRWSMKNRSRCLRISRKEGFTRAATSVAACPGPPARKNTGSGVATTLLEAGNQATFKLILRPCGSAGFSGTSKVAHCASTLPEAPAPDSVQGLKPSWPKWRRLSSLAGPGPPQAPSNSARPAARGKRWLCMEEIFLWRGVQSVRRLWPTNVTRVVHEVTLRCERHAGAMRCW